LIHTLSADLGSLELGFTVSDPPTQSEVQAILEKVNELINTVRR